MDFVDTHPHINADDLVKYPLSPIGGKLSAYAEKHGITAEQYLALMDEAGVAQAALVQSSTGHGYDNSYCADMAKKYSDRLVGVCCVDAPAPDSPEKLRYWIKERRMAGSRLFTAGSTQKETDWLDKPVAHPYFVEAEKLGIAVDISIKRTGIHMAHNVVKRYPNIRFILDHMSSPFFEDGAPYPGAQDMFALCDYPNLYLKFTTNNLVAAAKGASTVKDLFTILLDKFGSRRMLWGSNVPSFWKDGPVGSLKDLVELANRELAFVSEDDRRWMFGETARSLYPALRGE